MNKLPISESVFEALSFGWRNIGTILRIGWFPFTLVLLLNWGQIYLLAPEQIALMMEGGLEGADEWLAFAQDIDAATNTPIGIAAQIAVGLLSYLLLAGVIVAIFRMAGGGVPAPGGLIYIRLGGREWRLIIAYFIYILVGLLAAVVIFTPLVVVGFLLGSAGGIGGSVVFLLALAGVAIFIWFLIRLVTFFPATVIENRLVLFRSWRMTRGNAWRIFASLLLLLVVSLGLLFALGIGAVLAVGVFWMIVSALGGFGFIGGVLAAAIPAILFALFTAFYYGFTLSYSAIIYRHLADNG